jgi:hypothetical protein
MTLSTVAGSEAFTLPATPGQTQDHAAALARELAAEYARVTTGDVTFAQRLDALRLLGWRVLADRRWATSGRARIDAILVGPGGVVVLDAHAWDDVKLRAGVLYDGELSRDAEAAAVRSMTDKVHDALAVFGITRQSLWSVVALVGRHFETTAQQVHVVGEDILAAWLAARPARLEESEIDALTVVLENDFPVAEVEQPLGDRWPAAPVKLDVQRLTTALLRTATAPPVERWMTFLTDEQLALINTSWDGPARITGPAGTGKTVVGLHRAAYLAERDSESPVLFVAATAAHAGVAAEMMDRLTPQARDNVVCACLTDLAVAIVQQAKLPVNVGDRQASIAFVSAWMSSGRGGLLSQLDERPGYWQEEVDHVIKARGLTELDDYLALQLDDRRIPLDDAARTAVWRVVTEYRRRLGKSKVHDVNDVVTLARDLVRDGVVRPTYSAVIVDGVEDLPLVGLELMLLLAGEGPDRLLLIDDGQQAAYAGRRTLADAGIVMSDEPSMLTDDHRSSGDVLRLATRMIGTDVHLDVDGVSRPHLAGEAVRRRGPLPAVVEAEDLDALDRELVTRLSEINDSETYRGDVAVLVATRTDVDHVRAVLMRAALPVVDLPGVQLSRDHIVVGTYAEAKGLSFDHVLMPGIRANPARLPGEHEVAHTERVQRLRRLQYIGITRARHGLWLGYLTDPDGTC